MNKFNIDDVVLYQINGHFMLGVIKDYKASIKHYWNSKNKQEIFGFEYDDTFECIILYDNKHKIIASLSVVDSDIDFETYTDDEILEYLIETYKEYEYVTQITYTVQFNKDNSVISIFEQDLKGIENKEVFTILKRSSEDAIQDDPCKQLAAKILGDSPLVGGDYYAMEDYYTGLIKGEEPTNPCIGALKVFLYQEAEFRLKEIHNIKDPEPEQVEDVANILYDNEGIFNYDAMDDLIREYLEKEE